MRNSRGYNGAQSTKSRSIAPLASNIVSHKDILEATDVGVEKIESGMVHILLSTITSLSEFLSLSEIVKSFSPFSMFQATAAIDPSGNYVALVGAVLIVAFLLACIFCHLISCGWD